MNSISFLAFVALISAAYAGQLDFSGCPGSDAGVGTVTEVYCDQFSDWSDVVLKKGNTYTFGIKFKAGEASPGLGPRITGIIGGVSVPWSGVNADSCKDLVSGTCPIVSGKEYHYKASITILSSYPAVSLTFQWGLASTDSKGVKGKNQACFRMPAKITS